MPDSLKPVSKAVAGVLAVVLIQVLAHFGFSLTPELDGAVRLLVDTVSAAVLTWLFVYWAPKNKEVR